MDKVVDFINVNRDRYIEEMKQYLAIPSISALPEHKGDVRKGAEWTADEMRQLEKRAREIPSITRIERDLAASHSHLGVLQNEMGRPAEALASYERALAIRDSPVAASTGYWKPTTVPVPRTRREYCVRKTRLSSSFSSTRITRTVHSLFAAR